MRTVTFASCVSDSVEYSNCRSSIDSLDPVGFKVLVDAVDSGDNRYSCAAALNEPGLEEKAGFSSFTTKM